MSGNLGITQVAASQNQKEVTINAALLRLDAAISETFDADLTSSNVTVTTAQGQQCILIRAANVATSGRTVTVPQVERVFLIANPVASSHSVNFLRGSTTVTLTPGQTAAVRTDGTANGLVVLLLGSVSGGGGGGVTVEDEGTTVAGGPHTTFNFTGAGVVATNSGGGEVQVAIAGGGSGITLEDEGTTVTGGPHTTLNFTGAGVTVADAGSGEATVTIPGASLPSFRGAMAVKTANQSITGSGAIVSWDAEDYDTDNIWTSGNPTRLTVPSGVTRVRLVACLRQGTNNQNVTGNFRKNGSDAFEGNGFGYNYNTTGGVMIASPVLVVTSGDYFEAFFFPPTTMNITGGSTPRSWFAMEVVQ